MILVKVTVDVPVAPARTETLLGLAAIPKSAMVYDTLAVRLNPPPDPVTVTTYVPAEPEHESVEVPVGDVPLMEIDGGVSEHVRPEDGEAV